MEKKTDVLLVNPTRVGVDAYCSPPLHLMYLKRALNDEGYSVNIVNVHEMYSKKIGAFDNNERNLAVKDEIEKNAIAEILDWDAQLIGIGGVCPSYEFSEKLAIQIKSKKEVPIIVGGSLGLPLQDLWFKNTKVDYLCEADGERVIVNVMKDLSNEKALKKIPGLYWRTEIGWDGNKPDLPLDLDYIATPELRDIDYEFYMDIEREWINRTLPVNLRLKEHERVVPVLFSRGCVYNCLFCFHFNRRHRRHSIEYIIAYLTHLKKEFGVTIVITWDDLVMANPKWFMTLCDALADARLGIKIFSSGGKPNIVTEEIAKKMFQANFFRISFGIESGSQRILDEMQKKTTVEDNRRAIEIAAKAGLFVHANMVVGMPSETKETLQETFNFLVDVAKKNRLSMKNISFAFATGYPGTQLFDYMAQEGFAKDLRKYIISVKGIGNPDPVICKLSKKELQDFVARASLKINDLYFSKQKNYVKRLFNLIINNTYSHALRKYISPKTRDIMRNILSP